MAEVWDELVAAKARAEALVPVIAAHLALAELELEALRRSVPVPGLAEPASSPLPTSEPPSRQPSSRR